MELLLAISVLLKSKLIQKHFKEHGRTRSHCETCAAIVELQEFLNHHCIEFDEL